MTLYRCTLNPSHPPTDQRFWIGCHQCWVEQRATKPAAFFTTKHVHKPGDPINQWESKFTYDPSNHSLSIDSTGETVTLSATSHFINYWTDPARGELYWNKKHKSANWLTPQVGYGVTGSWSTATSGAFTSDLTGIQVAGLYSTKPHAYPVNPGYAMGDLETWPWRCACGAAMGQGEKKCLACRQGSS